jgi:predicted O-methyltransferase YrrM
LENNSGSWTILAHVNYRKIGMSPHYPTLYSIVSGLETKIAFEFGTGFSTYTILEALKDTGGKLYSVSTNTIDELQQKYCINQNNWHHSVGKTVDILSNQLKKLQENEEKIDFVLHDGAHDYATVLFDLTNILPFMKQYSILLVHDTLHSKCGIDVSAAIKQALHGMNYDRVTLPFGFGLDIIRINGNIFNGSIEIKKNKVGSKYVTNLTDPHF